MKKITFSIIGLGSRGLDAYAVYQKKHPDEMEIVAVADPRSERVEKAIAEYGIDRKNCFKNDLELLEKEKLSDALIIAHMDQDHVRAALLALEKGYHILLEKPISPKKEEVLLLQKKAREKNLVIAVCHVLRYTPFFRTLKKLLDEGRIGKLAAIDAIEHVGYWHQAHSFVRGNWRNDKTTSPMLMQKSCHDMDILRYLAASTFKSVSSFGSLGYFRRENAPEGSTDYCMDGCKVKDSCPFDAEKIYITNRTTGFDAHPDGTWPCNVLVTDPTREKLYEAIKSGPYGRCVFRCDNNVVDRQSVSILFENGVVANFLMTGCSKDNKRTMNLYGTEGEIISDMEKRSIVLRRFDQEEDEVVEVPKSLSGHGGGDEAIVSDFIRAVNGEIEISSSLEESIDSHLMVFLAEEFRTNCNKEEIKGNAYNPEEGVVFEWMGRAEGLSDEQ